MGIRSTRNISRNEAIQRIIKVYGNVLNKDYKQIEEDSFEPNSDVLSFVHNGPFIDIRNLDKYTDKMLEDIMDCNFYRYSMFDNYLITND